jgi:uncharacterized membrane protein YtjA (UPF0391 family)
VQLPSVVMLRVALVLFVAALASALVGLVSTGGTIALVARVGFYALVPLALVVAIIGLVRTPKRSITVDDVRADR